MDASVGEAGADDTNALAGELLELANYELALLDGVVTYRRLT